MQLILDFFRKDWMRKLFALIFAIIIYWNISDARQKEQNKKQYEQLGLREHSGMHIRKRKRYRDRPQ